MKWMVCHLCVLRNGLKYHLESSKQLTSKNGIRKLRVDCMPIKTTKFNKYGLFQVFDKSGQNLINEIYLLVKFGFHANEFIDVQGMFEDNHKWKCAFLIDDFDSYLNIVRQNGTEPFECHVFECGHQM